MNAQKFLSSKGNFLKKEDLRRDGPRRLKIAAVEESEGRGFDGKPPEAELHLVFTDGSRFALRATTNLQRVIGWFGHDTDAWVMQEIEVYFSPDVTNPRGGEPGGIRLQRPAGPARMSEPYVSDLEEWPAHKANGPLADRVRAVRSVSAPDPDDDIAF